MPTKKLTPKKAASRQMDTLIMAVLGLIVVGAAVIVWQAWTINVLEMSYSGAETYGHTAMLRATRTSAAKTALMQENEALNKRLARWNENAVGSSLRGEALKQALLASGFNADDPFLWEFYILRVDKIIDDPKTPYSILVISDGTQDRGLFVAKRSGMDEYLYVPGTFFMVPNYAHQVIQNVKWAASKQVGYEVLTKVEGPNPDEVEKKTIDIQE